MRRTDLTILAGFLLLPWVELWFAWQGARVPDAGQVALEVLGWAVIGACLARFMPEGWARSPLWAGVLPVAWTAWQLGPPGLTGLVYRIGLLVVAGALVVRAERARPFGLVAGLVAALVGGVGTRFLVLDKAAEFQSEGRVSSGSKEPIAQLIAEVKHGPFPPSLRTGGKGPPIVLISVDTLRADAGAQMASYKRLAAHGVAFPETLSTSSWTVPAVASFLTGRLPFEHGAGVDATGGLRGIAPGAPTLAEALDARGWTTAAFATNAWLTSGLGFHRGFQTWWHADELFHHRLALAGFPSGPQAHEGEAVVDRAIDWLQDAPDDGYFLWVHFIDAHLPYSHADGALEASLSDERLRSGMRLNTEIVAKAKAAYQHEVDYVDGHIGRLLDVLEAEGVLDRGLVVLTSDHGEELWDHGATGHGHTHHAEVVNVPLVIAGLKAPPPTGPVSLEDVPTTLAAVAGLDFGGGRDLRQPVPADRIVTTQGNSYFFQQRSAWGQGRHAIVRTPDQGPLDCYDRVLDPRELVRGVCDPADVVAQTALAVPGLDGSGQKADVSKAALRELGYVE